MKKIINKISLIVSVLWILGVDWSAQAQGGQIASGGGGIYKYGRPVTFGTANFYTSETALELSEIPELSNLLNFFLSTPYITAETKANYMNALAPARNRNYYLVRENTFTKEISDRLIESYMRALNIDKTERKNIRIYAVTDTNKGETYLLPDFYRLNTIEKQAILFHEAVWILYPNDSYRNVIDAEIKFQKYLEVNRPERLMSLLKTKYFSHADEVVAAVKSDLEHGYLNKLMPDGNLHFTTLFGKEWLDCHAAGRVEDCIPLLKNNIMAWSLDPEVSQSAFIQLLKSASKVSVSVRGYGINHYTPRSFINEALYNRGGAYDLEINHPFYSSSLDFNGLFYHIENNAISINLDFKNESLFRIYF